MKYTNTKKINQKTWYGIQKNESDIATEKKREAIADVIIQSTDLATSKPVHTFTTEWIKTKPLDSRLTGQQTILWKVGIEKIPEKWIPYIRWFVSCMPTTDTESQEYEVEVYKHGVIRVENKIPYREKTGRIALYDVIVWVRVVMISYAWATQPKAKLLIKLLNPEVSG